MKKYGTYTAITLALVLMTALSVPVFRRSTMKVPTFQIISHTFFWFRFPKKLDFPRKFDALPGAFFIEKIFIMLYNNSTT